MFKEFGILFIIFILTVIALRWSYIRRRRLYQYITISLFAATILLNIIYNLKYVYPTFVYEGVPIGDSRENLFVYKEDSQFQWHILNTISHNRSILLDKRGNLFEHYFKLFSKYVESFQVDQDVCDLLKNDQGFQYKGELDMVEQLDYAFPEWSGGEIPGLYLNEGSLQGEEKLVVVWIEEDETSNLYIMSAQYFENLTN